MTLAGKIGLVLGVFATLALIILYQPERPDALSDIKEYLSERLHLETTTELSISDERAPFYRINISSAEGGGYWAIVKYTGESTELITQGQDYPVCLPIDSAGVPIALEPYCFEAKLDGRIKDRQTQKELFSLETHGR